MVSSAEVLESHEVFSKLIAWFEHERRCQILSRFNWAYLAAVFARMRRNCSRISSFCVDCPQQVFNGVAVKSSSVLETQEKLGLNPVLSKRYLSKCNCSKAMLGWSQWIVQFSFSSLSFLVCCCYVCGVIEKITSCVRVSFTSPSPKTRVKSVGSVVWYSLMKLLSFWNLFGATFDVSFWTKRFDKVL